MVRGQRSRAFTNDPVLIELDIFDSESVKCIADMYVAVWALQDTGVAVLCVRSRGIGLQVS